jgi:hypothetical protein
MPNPLLQLPPIALPEQIPLILPQPKFQVGEFVRWQAVVEPDFGRVIGVIFSHEATHQVTGLHYLVLLDRQSPSYEFCIHDFAFEEDLEAIEKPPYKAEG